MFYTRKETHATISKPPKQANLNICSDFLSKLDLWSANYDGECIFIIVAALSVSFENSCSTRHRLFTIYTSSHSFSSCVLKTPQKISSLALVPLHIFLVLFIFSTLQLNWWLVVNRESFGNWNWQNKQKISYSQLKTFIVFSIIGYEILISIYNTI